MAVELHIDEAEGQVQRGCSLFDVAEELGVRVPTSCGGKGKCRECMVEVTGGMELLCPRSEAETHLDGSFRLSCQARVAAESGTIECHTLRRGTIRIEEGFTPAPGVARKYELKPAVVRDGDAILLDGERIDQASGPIHGLAIDLGTTTVVLRLIDLESGDVLATQSFENPQRFGGSDVLARVSYDTTHKGKLLRRVLLGYLGHAIEGFDCDPRSIYEVVLAGNSIMRDLFFGLDVYSLGQMPYRSLTEHEFREGRRDSTVLSMTGRKSGLPIHENGRVYILPIISSHVGADTAACLLAIDIANEERLVGLMDIGTNTELVVGNKDRLHAASCPAGPAFEGGSISCGMPGLEGAIERVRLSDNGNIELGVIGDGPPCGICGSGLVDLASELLRTGRMNRVGRLTDDSDRFVVDAARGIHLSEADIGQLAQAKAANVAGLHLVHRNYGIEFDDLEVLYLAGGFSRHLDLDAARNIGLIPNLPDDRIVQIGNASLEGAAIALRSVSRRKEIEALVKTIEHIELETFSEFFHFFAEGVQFAPFNSLGREEEIVR